MGCLQQEICDEADIETENVTIQVDPSRSDLVEMKRVDGRRYILVAVEGEATVNGVEVNIL